MMDAGMKHKSVAKSIADKLSHSAVLRFRFFMIKITKTAVIKNEFYLKFSKAKAFSFILRKVWVQYSHAFNSYDS